MEQVRGDRLEHRSRRRKAACRSDGRDTAFRGEAVRDELVHRFFTDRSGGIDAYGLWSVFLRKAQLKLSRYAPQFFP